MIHQSSSPGFVCFLIKDLLYTPCQDILTDIADFESTHWYALVFKINKGKNWFMVYNNNRIKKTGKPTVNPYV